MQSIVPLEIQESNYGTEVYLLHATKEPNTINILCVSEQLMLPSASVMRPSCVHASWRFCDASVRRLSASALRLTCVPPASSLRPFHALPAYLVGQLY